MLQMVFSKLKTPMLAWYEWMVLGAFGFLVVVLLWYRQELSDTEQQLKVSEEAIEQAVTITKTVKEQQEHDRQVLTSFSDTLVKRQREQQQQRAALMSEYLILKPGEVLPPRREPTESHHDDSNTTTQTNPPTETETPPERRPGPTVAPTETPPAVDDHSRIRRLARGMHDAYCRAGGTNSDCTP